MKKKPRGSQDHTSGRSGCLLRFPRDLRAPITRDRRSPRCSDRGCADLSSRGWGYSCYTETTVCENRTVRPTWRKLSVAVFWVPRLGTAQTKILCLEAKTSRASNWWNRQLCLRSGWGSTPHTVAFAPSFSESAPCQRPLNKNGAAVVTRQGGH